MRNHERQYVAMMGLGLFDYEDDPDGNEDTGRSAAASSTYLITSGGDFEVPLIEETLAQLLLARYSRGEYTLAQIRAWLIADNGFDTFKDDLSQHDAFDHHYFADIPDDALHLALLDTFKDSVQADLWSEERLDSAIAAVASYLPEWAGYHTEVVGWMGGDGGVLTIPENRTVDEALDYIAEQIDQHLQALEPELPQASGRKFTPPHDLCPFW